MDIDKTKLGEWERRCVKPKLLFGGNPDSARDCAHRGCPSAQRFFQRKRSRKLNGLTSDAGDNDDSKY